MPDSTALSIDIETYGACERDALGRLLPQQKTNGKHDGRFHPMRSMITDGVPLESLILTTSITLIEESPSCPLVLPTLTTSATPSSSHPTKPSLPQSVSTSMRGPTSSTTVLSEYWKGSRLSSMKPGQTMVFLMHLKDHREKLRSWLLGSNLLLGMNLLFDLSFLRVYPEYRFLLTRRNLLLDLSVLNYLQCEVRTAKSLKTMGPVLRTHSYDPETTLKDKRYPDPLWKDPTTGLGLVEYNAQDSHNTILVAQELAARTIREFGNTDKLSPYCIQFYNDVMWSCIRMVEAGIPMSRSILHEIEAKALAQVSTTNRAAAKRGLILTGKGSEQSKDAFIAKAITEIDKCQAIPIEQRPGTPSSYSRRSPSSSSSSSSSSASPISIRQHPMLVYTEKTKQISWGDQNRLLMERHLPVGHELLKDFAILRENSKARKLLGSYVHPLLYHKMNEPSDFSSALLPHVDNCPCCTSLFQQSTPQTSGLTTGTSTLPPSTVHLQVDDPDIGLGFPTVYLVPTHAKDSSDDEGGQQQGRLSFKKPSAQTFPKIIKRAYRSRFGRDGHIRSYDLSQAELRSAALLSGDKGLISAFERDEDLHSSRAISTFGLPYLIGKYGPNFLKSEAFKEMERQACKHGNFTDLNWGTAGTLQATILKKSGMLIPFKICDEIVKERANVRPGLYNWQCGLLERAARDHIIVLPFTGQSRSFAGAIQGNDKNEAINFPIQCVAANLMLRIQSRIDQSLPSINDPSQPCFMFVNKYDALYFDTRNSFAHTLDSMFAEAMHWVTTTDYWFLMQQYYGHIVPMKYDITIHKAEYPVNPIKAA